MIDNDEMPTCKHCGQLIETREGWHAGEVMHWNCYIGQRVAAPIASAAVLFGGME